MKTVRFTTRVQWRNWLVKNFQKEQEVWLVYAKQSTGKPRIAYNDAVEEALCFGWIDSVVKRVDDEHTAQRFTPRKAGSSYSQPNKERLRWLIENDMIHASVMEQVEESLNEAFVFPKDIVATIKRDKQAWEHYQDLSGSYKRIRVAFIDAARKRPEEFKKRLENFIRKTHKGQMIKGYGGIEKYY